VVVALNFIFLYFPIVSLIAFSFNDSKRNVTPWQGFTLKYYDQAFHNSGTARGIPAEYRHCPDVDSFSRQ